MYKGIRRVQPENRAVRSSQGRTSTISTATAVRGAMASASSPMAHSPKPRSNSAGTNHGRTRARGVCVTRQSPQTLRTASCHRAIYARADRADETDWPQITALYQLLLCVQPSPVIELNHAAAVAMAQGPQAGLKLLDELSTRAKLRDYCLLPAARRPRRSAPLSQPPS